MWGGENFASASGDVGERVRFFIDSGMFDNNADMNVTAANSLLATWSQIPWGETSLGLLDPDPDIHNEADRQMMLDDLAKWGMANGVKSSAEMKTDYEGLYPSLVSVEDWGGLKATDAGTLSDIYTQAMGMSFEEEASNWVQGLSYEEDLVGKTPDQIDAMMEAHTAELKNNVLRMIQNRHEAVDGMYYVMPPELAEIITPNGPYGQGVADTRDGLLVQLATVSTSFGSSTGPSPTVTNLLEGVSEEQGNRMLRALITPEDAILPHELDAIFDGLAGDSPIRQMFLSLTESTTPPMDVYELWDQVRTYGNFYQDEPADVGGSHSTLPHQWGL